MSRNGYRSGLVTGIDNVVADALLRYYKNEMEGKTIPVHDYVNADLHLDPEGNDLP